MEFVRVVWPSGTVQEWKNLQGNFKYVMVEGDSAHKQVPLRERSGPTLDN
jgi:hypothetical protein